MYSGYSTITEHNVLITCCCYYHWHGLLSWRRRTHIDSSCPADTPRVTMNPSAGTPPQLSQTYEADLPPELCKKIFSGRTASCTDACAQKPRLLTNLSISGAAFEPVSVMFERVHRLTNRTNVLADTPLKTCVTRRRYRRSHIVSRRWDSHNYNDRHRMFSYLFYYLHIGTSAFVKDKMYLYI